MFKYILFADDTNLLCCDRDVNELVRVINGGLTTADMFFDIKKQLHDFW